MAGREMMTRLRVEAARGGEGDRKVREARQECIYAGLVRSKGRRDRGSVGQSDFDKRVWHCDQLKIPLVLPGATVLALCLAFSGQSAPITEELSAHNGRGRPGMDFRRASLGRIGPFRGGLAEKWFVPGFSRP
ncbi:hypothetical protein DAEQUDRAFT_388295 [Daedalea quercina L-15889]|uniref:Uncharacterized protein n=1 Tax=Daedalea quercina L-15889 TaxID=1314783 RepID=A0A165NYN2_9APHY|nr:hypothetical protein DAEQUDRAFT_388295 [Daedalea quercina L-15889]